MRYRVSSVMFEESELLKEYPILNNFNLEIEKSLGIYNYSEAYITITTLEELQTLVANVGYVIFDKEDITIYDDYIE